MNGTAARKKVHVTEQELSDSVQSLTSWFNSVKPYLLYRKEDDILIIPPNLVYKLNRTATTLLRYLFSGGTLADVCGGDKERIRDIDRFFREIQNCMDGKPIAPDSVPYDFNFTRLPVLGEIAVTKRCNNGCLFCYAGCPEGNTYHEMSGREIKKIIRVFRREAKIPFFSFTGGEPLLRDDLEELIAYAVNEGLRTNLVSNGTLITEKRAEQLYNAGLRTAQISVESGERRVHDTLCGRESAFDQTLSGIKALQRAGISVQTNTTICAPNRETVPTMPSFLRDIGIQRFAMNMYIPSYINRYNQDLLVPYTEIGDIVEDVRKEAARLGMTFYWYSPTPFCIYNPVARGLGNKSCAAMDGLLSVNCDGEVFPCSSYEMPMGNLLREKFKTIWFSERARFFKMKKYAPPECSGCSAFTACQAACPLYWNACGTGEIVNPDTVRNAQ